MKKSGPPVLLGSAVQDTFSNVGSLSQKISATFYHEFGNIIYPYVFILQNVTDLTMDEQKPNHSMLYVLMKHL